MRLEEVRDAAPVVAERLQRVGPRLDCVALEDDCVVTCACDGERGCEPGDSSPRDDEPHRSNVTSAPRASKQSAATAGLRVQAHCMR